MNRLAEIEDEMVQLQHELFGNSNLRCQQLTKKIIDCATKLSRLQEELYELADSDVLRDVLPKLESLRVCQNVEVNLPPLVRQYSDYFDELLDLEVDLEVMSPLVRQRVEK